MPRAHRILLLITDLHLGGSPLMLQSLALGLSALASPRFDIHVCSLAPLSTDSPIPTALREAHIPVHSLDLTDLSPRTAAAGLAAYRKLLQQIDPDLVYSILIHANALATLGKQTTRHRHKLVHAIHTLQPEPRWHWTLQGAIAHTADAVLAPSQAILDRIATFGPFQQGAVVPNGIDTDRFGHARAREEPPGARHRTRLGYIGRFDPVKRLDLLLEAVSILPAGGYELFLVGYGEQEPALRDLATSLHIAPFVHFPGPTREPERWYKSFDLHVLPSPVEGFGLTLVESLAAGVPVVAVDTPVTAGIVRKNVDGVLISPLSASTLAEAIQEVARWLKTGAWDAAGAQQCVATHFSVKTMLGRHAQILEKILAD